MERAAVSQPGVEHIRVNYPEGDALLIYDRNQTAVSDIIKAVEAKRPDLQIVVEAENACLDVKCP